MLTALLASLALALITGVAGLPLTLARPSSRSSIATLALDAMLVGTAVLVATLSVWIWLGAPAGVVFVLVYLALSGTALRRGGPLELPGRTPTLNWFTVSAAVLLVVGVALRLRTVEFLPWAGDMGNYVNAANELVRTGELRLGFPPGFAVFLAVPSQLFGRTATTAAVPFLGALTLGSVLRIGAQLELRRTARLTALALLTVSTVAVWYASFPVSETLQAPLTLLLLSAATAHVTSPTRSHAATAADLGVLFLAGLALGLSRGTGPLLLLPLLLLLAACAHPAWSHLALASSRVLASSAAGLAVSYVYGVHRIAGYFVDLQISSLLPTRVFSVMTRLGLLRVSVQLFVMWLALIAGALVLGWLLDRWGRRRPRPAAADRSRWPLPLTAALAVGTAALLALQGRGEIWNQIGRMGWVLLAVGVVAQLLPSSVRRGRGPFVVLGGSVVLLMLGLHSMRFDAARAHSFFLYWDRYLYSEVLPVLILLVGLSLHAAAVLVDPRPAPGADPARPRSRRVVITRALGVTAALALVLAYTGSQLNGLRLVTDRTTFAGATDFFEDLDDLARDRSVPLLWSASGAGPDGWPIFPNSWHAYGRTMEHSFGRVILKQPPPAGPFEPDRVLDAWDVRRLLACAPDERAYAVEFSREGDHDLGQRLERSPLEVDLLGELSADLPLMRHLDTKKWESMPLRAAVWRVDGRAASLPPCPTQE